MILYIWYMVVGTIAGVSAWGYLLRFLYKTKGAWKRSLTGVALVTLATALALALTNVGVNLWLRVLTGSADWPGRLYVSAGLFSLLALAVTLIWVAFERAQRR